MSMKVTGLVERKTPCTAATHCAFSSGRAYRDVVRAIADYEHEARRNVGSINPCSLLNEKKLKWCWAITWQKPKFKPSPRPNCEYSVGEGSVTVFVFNDPSAAGGFQAGKTMQDAKTEPSRHRYQAYWSPDIQALNVLKGNIYFTVQFYRVPSGSKETMKALAQKAVTRLP